MATLLADGTEKTSQFFDISCKELQALFQKIKHDRNACKLKSKPIDELLAAKRKELKDYIFRLAADTAAVMFVGAAAALTVGSGSAIAFKNTTRVDGLVLRNTFKTFYSKMDWDKFMTALSASALCVIRSPRSSTCSTRSWPLSQIR
ncbi:hypothetical protein COCCADRAFT_30083 [Bipolaris zeicola 26-R-13]|uniref:Uncharacterized protein n=1 Tax=Cochliobolus carbonum (strain 26-R-13) TaxID=930089 RepID=W6Y148_COCC2|nr:uncharacterized protein COCCADRAFT_30083 [Bipolaris zeicola 26-R-13]EUC28714.1 hypothetical protein COCCADRAFT_30083 [Bipolaris zeicola 26-R-13]